MSNYDMTMEIEDSSNLHGWTAPRSKHGKYFFVLYVIQVQDMVYNVTFPASHLYTSSHQTRDIEIRNKLKNSIIDRYIRELNCILSGIETQKTKIRIQVIHNLKNSNFI